MSRRKNKVVLKNIEVLECGGGRRWRKISYRQISRKGHLHCSGEDVLNAGHRNLLGNV